MSVPLTQHILQMQLYGTPVTPCAARCHTLAHELTDFLIAVAIFKNIGIEILHPPIPVPPALPAGGSSMALPESSYDLALVGLGCLLASQFKRATVARSLYDAPARGRERTCGLPTESS
jgi:hypothetical protein